MNLCQGTYEQNDGASGLRADALHLGQVYGGGVMSMIALWLAYMRAALICFSRDGIWPDTVPTGEVHCGAGCAPNRKQRRAPERPVPASRQLNVYHALLGRDLTWTQFLERFCAVSVNGRIFIYRLRQWAVKPWGRRYYARIFSTETRIHTPRPPP